MFPPDQIVGVFDPLDDIHAAETGTSADNVVDDRDHGCATQATGYQHHVVAFRLCHGPAAAVRSADAQAIPRAQSGKTPGDPSHRTNRVVQDVLILGIGNNGNGYLADTVEIHHVELAWGKCVARVHRGIGKAQAQRE